MVEKELKKLRRQELLTLLLDQSREASGLQKDYEESERQIRNLEDSNNRLSVKLEEKEMLIEKLQGRLEKKERQAKDICTEISVWKFNRDSELKASEDMAEAALRLNGLYKMAQQAADQYVYNIRQRCGKKDKEAEEMPDTRGGLKIHGA